MTGPASVMVPLVLVKRVMKALDRGGLGECRLLGNELAALLPEKPDRARELYERINQAHSPNEAIEVIRAELDAPRPMTPEVADLISRLKDAEHAYRGTRSATACLQAADFLSAQFEVRHDR